VEASYCLVDPVEPNEIVACLDDAEDDVDGALDVRPDGSGVRLDGPDGNQGDLDGPVGHQC